MGNESEPRTYNVQIVCPKRADLRRFQIIAENLLSANELAEEAVARLPPKLIEAISVDGSDHGGIVDPVVIVDVSEDCFDWPCRSWSR